MRKKIYLTTLLIFIVTLMFSASALADSSTRPYEKAKAEYRKFLKSPSKKKYRHNWIGIIRKFEVIAEKYPKGEKAPHSLYMMGNAYQNLYKYSRRSEDINSALGAYRKLASDYPNSHLADDAMFLMGQIYENDLKNNHLAYLEYYRLTKRCPEADMAGKAEKRLEALKEYRPPLMAETRETSSPPEASGSVPHVTDINYLSGEDYTKIVIYLDRPAKFDSRLLKPDPKINIYHPRLYVDLDGAKLNKDVKKEISVNDGLIKQARAAQYQLDTVRVVLDIESLKRYKVYHLDDPFRVIMEVFGEGVQIAEAKPGEAPSLYRQLGLKVGTIVIDPGHGGKDPGALSKSKRLREKDINLKVSKYLAQYIKEELNCRVILTRSDDRFISLDRRPAIAIKEKADLFISIHTNASRNVRANGVETFILNLATNEEAMRVAAQENATSSKKLSDLQKIYNQILISANVPESRKLARHVQQETVRALKGGIHPKVADRGIDQAPFYVLINVQKPAILVELCFISNSTEARLLARDQFHRDAARGILNGIKAYLDSINQR